MRGFFAAVGMLFLLPGCAANLASAIGAGTQAQIKLQTYFLTDFDRMVWVEQTCYDIQRSRTEFLKSRGAYDAALFYLAEMREAPLPFDFIQQVRKNPNELFADPRWCGNPTKPTISTEEAEVEIMPDG